MTKPELRMLSRTETVEGFVVQPTALYLILAHNPKARNGIHLWDELLENKVGKRVRVTLKVEILDG